MKKRCGFTLVELMVVILIVSVLAAVSVPMMRGKIDEAKWAEANATAGTIRRAHRLYFLENESTVTGKLSDATVQQTLGIEPADLTGTYFVPSDYEIDSVSADGTAVVTVTGSQTNAPAGSKTLGLDGSWE